MPRRNTVFRGLSRPAEWGGLPVIYLLVILGMTMLSFFMFGIASAIIAGFVFYTGLRLFYEWEPAFFRVLSVTLSKTPRTKNRQHHGGDYYSA